MYFPGISENDENQATDLCGHIPENLTILVIDKVLNLRAAGFGYHRYEEEYRNGTKFLIDYEVVKGEITTVTGNVQFVSTQNVLMMSIETILSDYKRNIL